MDYGQLFRKQRKLQGLTQDKLARMVGVTPSLISKIENNEQDASEFVARRLGQILKISAAEATYVSEPPKSQLRLPLGMDQLTDRPLPSETILDPGPPSVAFWDISQTIPELSYLTHNYFRYFGKFPPAIPRQLLMDYRIATNASVLDMFCGCGTTLVEAKLAGIHTVGVDCNPFGILASRVKTTCLDPTWLNSELNTIMSSLDHVRVASQYLPSNSLDLSKWFTNTNIDHLAKLKGAILKRSQDKYREFFALAFFAIIRRVSHAFDGEVRPHVNPRKRQRDVAEAFLRKCQDMITRMRHFSEQAHNDAVTNALHGDNRNLAALLSRIKRPVHLIITHPPYLNCFDYTPVYKLEFAWADKFEELGEQAGYRNVHSMEIRSWPASTTDFIDNYFNNLRTSFVSAYDVLVHRGICCVVLGDATTHGKLIPVLDQFRSLMESLGFTLDKIAYRSTHYGTGKYAYKGRADYHGNGENSKKDAVLIFKKP